MGTHMLQCLAECSHDTVHTALGPFQLIVTTLFYLSCSIYNGNKWQITQLLEMNTFEQHMHHLVYTAAQ